MFSLNIIAQFFVGQGSVPPISPFLRIPQLTTNSSRCTVASSRVVFAYSRDGALPGSRWLKIVNNTTKTPVNAVWFVITVGALLGLLMFASPVAIGAVFSIGAIAQYVAFIFPVALKLFVVGDKFRPGTPLPAL
jgi:amino acid transporter